MMTIEEAEKKYGKLEEFDSRDENSRVWRTAPVDSIGIMFFTFDKKHLYNLFSDIPNELTPEQKKIFAEDEPMWAKLRGII
ncbi:MAG: hypothetical protein LUC18_00290 [Porphyromonadaceae bacterium]|nr:hypothetical protein [Porphyromonadaceae bacterium]